MQVVVDNEYGQVRLDGRLDIHSVADVRAAVHEAIDRGHGDLVVDVGGVEVADATGLGVLVGAHRRAERAGRRLVLRQVTPRLSRLLLATRLHRILHLEQTIDLDAVLVATA